MKPFFYWGIPLLCLINLSACKTNKVSAGKTKYRSFTENTFLNEEWGYEIAYPKEWELELNGQELSITEPYAMGFPRGFHVAVVPHRGEDLDELVEVSIQEAFRSKTDPDVLDDQSIEIDRLPGRKVTLQLDFSDLSYAGIQYILVNEAEGLIYVLTGICTTDFFEISEPTFEAMALSFKAGV
ncbi:MAG: hypothetical protein AAFV80_02235 [Bacteroidota bacterium]